MARRIHVKRVLRLRWRWQITHGLLPIAIWAKISYFFAAEIDDEYGPKYARERDAAVQAKEPAMTMPKEVQERIKAGIWEKIPFFGCWGEECSGDEFDLDPKMYERPNGPGAMVRIVCSHCPEGRRKVQYFDISPAPA